MASATSAPLFILASPRSFTSLVCAMLGQNPGAYGLPEVNLFADATLDALCKRSTDQRQFLIHGLVRTVSQLYVGEQTVETVGTAWRWINKRREHTTSAIYHELAQRVAPLVLVDKSPIYSNRREVLDRIVEAFPAARFLYLLRNPIDQGNSMIQAPQGFMQLVASRSLDARFYPPRIEPQVQWLRTQRLILDFLKKIPEERQFRLVGESLLREPEPVLTGLCTWLGLPCDEAALTEMLHPENSPYAAMGPIGAQWGNNPGFQRSPQFRRSTKPIPALDRAVPWHAKGEGLFADVANLARTLGYPVSTEAEEVAVA